MSRGINKVILIGNLGNDPDVRYMPNGNAVANISLATSDSWKDRETGQLQTRTEWHRVVFFGRLAEVVGQYLRKGSKIYVEGRLQTREWEKDGVKRYSTEVVVDMGGQMQMLDGRGDGAPADGYAARQAQQASQPQAAAQTSTAPTSPPAPAPQATVSPDYAVDNSFDEEIPF